MFLNFDRQIIKSISIPLLIAHAPVRKHIDTKYSINQQYYNPLARLQRPKQYHIWFIIVC